MNKHRVGAADGHSTTHVRVQSHLEPTSRVFGVAGILQAVLVTLDKELQVEPGEGEWEG